MKDSKRENAELVWTLVPGRQHNGQTFTCRAENPALKQPLLTSVEVQVNCKYPASFSRPFRARGFLAWVGSYFFCFVSHS